MPVVVSGHDAGQHDDDGQRGVDEVADHHGDARRADTRSSATGRTPRRRTTTKKAPIEYSNAGVVPDSSAIRGASATPDDAHRVR